MALTATLEPAELAALNACCANDNAELAPVYAEFASEKAPFA